MNAQIKAIYESRKVVGKDGTEIQLHSEVDPAEGAFIHRIISQDPDVLKTIEVGCAYGLSSLHICDALSQRHGVEHLVIDPYQNSHWSGAGVRNLEEAGVRFFKLIEKGSEFALPELLSAGEGRFDLVFVDGNHTFDHALLDCFYATRLLRTGGYLVIDDANMRQVGRVVAYLSEYPCYQVYATLGDRSPLSLKHRVAKAILGLVPSSKRKRLIHPVVMSMLFDQQCPRMLAFKKIAEDQRTWDWYPSGF